MARRPAPDLRRHRPRREPKRRFIIFCEGEKTEPAYFAAIRRTCADALIDVQTIAPAGVPYTLAQSAADRARELGLGRRSRRPRNSFEEGDEVWAVFDRDEHPRYLEAVRLCEDVGVGVGRSNPCFELWLILHEADFDRPDGRHAVQAHLHGLLPEYDPAKRKTPNCADLIARVEDAERRAGFQLVRRENEGSPHGRPSSTVGLLTRSIRIAAERARRLP
jgi:RloB-like protein